MIRHVDRSSFNIAPSEQPATATRELAWYATGDDAVLGVVILNVASETYAWAVLTEKVKGQGFAAIASGNGVTGGLPMQQFVGRSCSPCPMRNLLRPVFGTPWYCSAKPEAVEPRPRRFEAHAQHLQPQGVRRLKQRW